MFAYPASTTYSLPTGYAYPAGYGAPVSYNTLGFGALPTTTFGYPGYSSSYSSFPSQFAYPSTLSSFGAPATFGAATAAPASSKIKVTYFDMAGRAEPIRLALFIGGVPFEDERLSRDEWNQNVKPNSRFGQLPLLEVGGKVLAQTYAQLIFVGQLAGLYPEDSWERAKVHEALFLGEDILQALVPSLREQNGEKKKELRAKFVEELPRFLGYVEKLLAETNTGYLAGPKLTIADLNLFVIVTWLSSGTVDDVPLELFNKFARIAEFRERIQSLPRVAEWLAEQEKAKKAKEDKAAAEKIEKEIVQETAAPVEENNKPADE